MTTNDASQKSGTAAAATAEEVLSQTGLLKALPEEVRARLAALGSIETLPSGHHLVVQGTPENRLIVVLSGTLVVSRHRLGNRAQVGVLRKGDTIGAMHLIDPHPASADIVVVDGSAIVWAVPDAEIQELLSSDPATGFLILKALARQICSRTRHDRNNLWERVEAWHACFRDMDF